METANYHDCKECRWAVKKDGGAFECHRFPPVSFGDKYGRFGWEFPLVCEDANEAFCGEQWRIDEDAIVAEDLCAMPLSMNEEDISVENTPWCKTCRWSFAKKDEQGRHYFVCHRNPPVQRNDLEGRTRYEFPVVSGMDEECFCGEYEEEPEVAE